MQAFALAPWRAYDLVQGDLCTDSMKSILTLQRAVWTVVFALPDGVYSGYRAEPPEDTEKGGKDEGQPVGQTPGR